MSDRKRILDSVAVAIKYRPVEGDTAPLVTAKGKGFVAERIKEVARENGIPIHEDEGLARLLSAVELNAEIPYALFGAVAEVLALIYRADSELRKRSLGE